jgi:hypothetical protein
MSSDEPRDTPILPQGVSEQPAPSRSVKAISPIKTTLPPNDDTVGCERCGGEIYRMHAVWRCSQCGYKTDCCGW